MDTPSSTDGYDFNLLSERIKYIRKTYDLTLTRIAEIAGVKQPSVSAWLSGNVRKMNAEAALKLGRHLNINPIWLATGNRTPASAVITNSDNKASDTTVQIRESAVRFYAGMGRQPDYEELETTEPATYRLSFFQHLRVRPENCLRFRVEGDSMSPFINNGDMILVNTSDTTPKTGRVYALCLNNELKVKRLLVKANGGLIIRSDNPSYPDDNLDPDGFAQYIHIIGRVIERSGTGNL